jgi:hypothetical protein
MHAMPVVHRQTLSVPLLTHSLPLAIKQQINLKPKLLSIRRITKMLAADMQQAFLIYS